MDWHKLQHTLYNMDPVDPREDLARLAAHAQNTAQEAVAAKDYVTESIEIPDGSMPLGIDSISDFAALAGVRVDEKKQKHADKVRGSEPMPKAKAGRTRHPYQDRLVGDSIDYDIDEGPLDAFNQGRKAYQSGWAAPDSAEKAIKKKLSPDSSKASDSKSQIKTGGGNSMRIATALGTSNTTLMNQAIQRLQQGQPLSRNHYGPIEEAFKNLLTMDRKQLQRIMAILAQGKTSESVEEAAPSKAPQERNPHSQDLSALRKSGAGGAHKDKKRQLSRKQKHKSKMPNETIKEELYRRLNEKK